MTIVTALRGNLIPPPRSGSYGFDSRTVEIAKHHCRSVNGIFSFPQRRLSRSPLPGIYGFLRRGLGLDKGPSPPGLAKVLAPFAMPPPWLLPPSTF
jgi:hypothetical protein